MKSNDLYYFLVILSLSLLFPALTLGGGPYINLCNSEVNCCYGDTPQEESTYWFMDPAPINTNSINCLVESAGNTRYRYDPSGAYRQE